MDDFLSICFISLISENITTEALLNICDLQATP